MSIPSDGRPSGRDDPVGRHPAAIAPAGHTEPVPRRIRATLGSATVLDTTSALYLWEWPFYPQYLIPAEDVLAQFRKRGRLHEGMLRFEWDALDAWFEEDEQVFVHPRNPYVRVDALRSSRHVRVELDGELLAESGAPVLVFETGLPTRFYFDRTAVRLERLEPSETVTPCPYKGRTSQWWSVRTASGVSPDVAWSYEYPTRELSPIAGLVAFYDEKVDVFVDGVQQERPKTHFVS